MWPFKRKSKDLTSILNRTKNVWLKDVLFVIKKIDVQSYLAGYRAVQKTVDLYDNKKANESIPPSLDNELESIKKLRDHYMEVILSGCVSPKFTKTNEPGAIPFEELFLDWDLATQLYQEIMAFTNQKKK